MEATALAERAKSPAQNSLVSSLGNVRIGPMPLPVYAATALVASIAVATGKLPNDVIGGLLVMMLAGFSPRQVRYRRRIAVSSIMPP